MYKDNITGYYAVSYAEMLPILIEAFHEMNNNYHNNIEINQFHIQNLLTKSSLRGNKKIK